MQSANNYEKDASIEQLKSVIYDKDQVVSHMHKQMEKLMERLSNAEQKLFEYQDSFTDDG